MCLEREIRQAPGTGVGTGFAEGRQDNAYLMAPLMSRCQRFFETVYSPETPPPAGGSPKLRQLSVTAHMLTGATVVP